MRKILFLSLLITHLSVHAQVDCRSTEYRQQLINSSPQMLAKIAAIEAFTQNQQKNNRTVTNGEGNSIGNHQTAITIPVVVHILYNASAQNISDQQVLSQIDVLNKDYTRLNADSNSTPVVFRQFAANCGFHFELAKVDSMGYATTGIIRKHTSILGFSLDDKIKFSSMGGDDAWDKNQYLNIWVGNLSGGILGYSSVVGGPRANDGVVVLYSAFGSGGSAVAPFNRGRTATHEIGHWLNLIHTWGDANCGDDHVADTPPQQTADRGCPSGVLISCNNAPYGNMYTNYMDFTNDDCMNLFTSGQNERMHALFVAGGERFAMLSSAALAATPLDTPVSVPVPGDSAMIRQIAVFPNPATSVITIQFNDQLVIGSTLEIYNQVGQKVISTKVTALLLQLNVSALNKGIYYIKVRDCSKNGNTAKLIKL